MCLEFVFLLYIFSYIWRWLLTSKYFLILVTFLIPIDSWKRRWFGTRRKWWKQKNRKCRIPSRMLCNWTCKCTMNCGYFKNLFLNIYTVYFKTSVTNMFSYHRTFQSKILIKCFIYFSFFFPFLISVNNLTNIQSFSQIVSGGCCTLPTIWLKK